MRKVDFFLEILGSTVYKISLVLLFLILNAQFTYSQYLFGGALSRTIAKDSLKNTAYSYAIECHFFADAIANNSLPQQLGFKIFSKKNNKLIREFKGKRISRNFTRDFKNDCPDAGGTPELHINIVTYYNEQIIDPKEFTEPEGYLIVNDPIGPRSPSANILSTDLVLYHWFSPKYLFEKIDNPDEGVLTSGWLPQYPSRSFYVCKN